MIKQLDQLFDDTTEIERLNFDLTTKNSIKRYLSRKGMELTLGSLKKISNDEILTFDTIGDKRANQIVDFLRLFDKNRAALPQKPKQIEEILRQKGHYILSDFNIESALLAYYHRNEIYSLVDLFKSFEKILLTTNKKIIAKTKEIFKGLSCSVDNISVEKLYKDYKLYLESNEKTGMIDYNDQLVSKEVVEYIKVQTEIKIEKFDDEIIALEQKLSELKKLRKQLKEESFNYDEMLTNKICK